ncbi:flavin reductase family protein [uncultured Alsobacter sp.]|uniref:flavin reductase family protein n=1 Tax=uncultured Alsobacter sp. TaxID=1748258 RepID=UPI0025DBCD40|nr:flavin reductase family protein [uncultured Alsobacter sp.]
MTVQTTRAGEGERPVVATDAFRNAMGHLAMPVAVVAAGDGGERDAVTTTTLCSASVDPPTLIVSVNRHSPLNALAERSRAFSVNVLTDEQATIGRVFSDARRTGERRFGQGTWTTGATGSPLLEDTLATFDCELVQTLDYGPNRILIGRVVAIGFGEKQPLLYRDGFFRRLTTS